MIRSRKPEPVAAVNLSLAGLQHLLYVVRHFRVDQVGGDVRYRPALVAPFCILERALWFTGKRNPITTSTRCCARMFNLSRAGEQFCRSLARRIRRYGKVISADATLP